MVHLHTLTDLEVYDTFAEFFDVAGVFVAQDVVS